MLFWVKAGAIRVCVFTVLALMLSAGWWYFGNGVGGAYGSGVDWGHYVSWVGLGAMGMAFSDGLVHGLLWIGWRERYGAAFRAFAFYFEGQSRLAMGVGALLAGVEEIFFRGGILFFLLEVFPGSGFVPLLGSSVLFGLAHTLRTRSLAPFGLWAVWEGILLGTLFLLSGSLWVVATVHVFHDLFGFMGLWAVRNPPKWWRTNK